MMKYIIIERAGLELPILFPSIINHVDMWFYVRKTDDTVVSAGFVRKAMDDTLRAFGESESIGITSRPDIDSTLIEKFLKRG